MHNRNHKREHIALFLTPIMDSIHGLLSIQIIMNHVTIISKHVCIAAWSLWLYMCVYTYFTTLMYTIFIKICAHLPITHTPPEHPISDIVPLCSYNNRHCSYSVFCKVTRFFFYLIMITLVRSGTKRRPGIPRSSWSSLCAQIHCHAEHVLSETVM